MSNWLRSSAGRCLVSPRAPLRASARRPGYTLIELLLVLAIVLLLSGFAWTSVSDLYGRQRLREAAEQVRAELAAGRYRATDTGEVIEFRFTPGGRAYASQAWGSSITLGEHESTAMATLPETMRFQLVADAAPLETASVLLHPEGTATGAMWDIVDQHDRAIRISVRSLTAAVRVQPIQATVSR